MFQGLNDLYDFQQQHKQVDIDPFLKQTSEFFQKYIARGLKTIEEERKAANSGTKLFIITRFNEGESHLSNYLRANLLGNNFTNLHMTCLLYMVRSDLIKQWNTA